MKEGAGSRTILGKNLRALRTDKGLSQGQLAEDLHLNRSNIASYESKGIEPKLTTVVHIARYFDVSVKILLTDDISKYGGNFPPFNRDISRAVQDADLTGNHSAIEQFVEKTMEVKKILEGFRAFYDMKKRRSAGEEFYIGAADVNNLLDLLEEVIKENEAIIHNLPEG